MLLYDTPGVKRVNPVNANHTKWSNTLKQFVGKLPANCLSVFDHFVKLGFKGLISYLVENSYLENSSWFIPIVF